MSVVHPNNTELLNSYQRRSLATTLSVLEEMLCEIERTLTGGGYKGILFELRDDISPSVKEEILKRISLIKERAEALAEQFTLEKRVDEAGRDFMGKLSYGWEILEGAKAAHQQGYGTVAEGLGETLDPQIDGILFLVNEMRDLVTGQKKD